MKKIFKFLAPLVVLMAMVFAPKANANEIADVSAEYWAAKEIYQMVNDGIPSHVLISQ